MKRDGRVSRRSFLSAVTGTALAAPAAAALQNDRSNVGPVSDAPSRPRRRRGVTDCDSGPRSDPPNHGDGLNPATGITDRDTGAKRDIANCGRRATRPLPLSQPGAA